MARRIAPVAWWLLAFVLVAAQALGWMHRIVHGPQAPSGHHQAAEHPAGEPADDHAGHAHATGWMAALFAGHADDSTCRLFDPLNHDSLPAVPVLVLPLAPGMLALRLAHGGFVARWRALFDARGPPTLR